MVGNSLLTQLEPVLAVLASSFPVLSAFKFGGCWAGVLKKWMFDFWRPDLRVCFVGQILASLSIHSILDATPLVAALIRRGAMDGARRRARRRAQSRK